MALEKRYSVLRTMVMNKESSFYNYNKSLKNYNFGIVVSPFIELSKALDNPNPYSFMKSYFVKGLTSQFPDIPANIKDKTDGLI